MGAFTAVELDPRAICNHILWKYFIKMGLFWSRILQVLIAFLRLLLLEYWGGPEKDRNVCLWLWDTMLALLGFVWPTECPWA